MPKLLIKQRVFSWTDSYDIYDENENARYFAKAELFSFGHQIHVFDKLTQNEVGVVRQKLLTLLPKFEIEINGRFAGTIQKKFTMLRPQYEIDFNGWNVEGNIMGWNYDVTNRSGKIMHIYKELFRWGDTYIIDYRNPEDEMMGLMLVIAIDAANCSDN